MMVLVSYDVSTVTPEGARRLRQIAQHCLNYGIRVQKSVFECNISEGDWLVLRKRLLETYNPNEDSLRFYFLGNNWQQRVEHHGAAVVQSIDDPLIF
ncbi:MAG: CRISPR-associated endonuclease Cas2 [Chlorobiota bacterium]|jgi:CRISPR-associated protein Cas2|nr:MAG: CRISPR-associated endonuclease Cas2 [Chlorobiota bacterium]